MTFHAIATGFWIGLSVVNLVLLGIALLRLRRLGRRMKRRNRLDKIVRRKMTMAIDQVGADVRKNDEVQARRFDRSIWPQIESLISLYRVLDGRIELPPMRRWSASPDFLLHVVGHIRRHAPKVIVECGSGTSTIVLAHGLRVLAQDAHIYAIENHEPSAAKVREQLRRHGLERFVTLIDAPLVEKRYDGFATVFQWYDLAPGALPREIDLLIVDGPFSLINRYARYPAGPELLPRLSRNAHVFVDDADRREEKAMMRLWRRYYPDLGIRTLPAEKGCAELFFLDRKIEDYLPAEWRAAG